MREVRTFTPYCSELSTSLNEQNYMFKSPDGPLNTEVLQISNWNVLKCEMLAYHAKRNLPVSLQATLCYVRLSANTSHGKNIL